MAVFTSHSTFETAKVFAQITRHVSEVIAATFDLPRAIMKWNAFR